MAFRSRWANRQPRRVELKLQLHASVEKLGLESASRSGPVEERETRVPTVMNYAQQDTKDLYGKTARPTEPAERRQGEATGGPALDQQQIRSKGDTQTTGFRWHQVTRTYAPGGSGEPARHHGRCRKVQKHQPRVVQPLWSPNQITIC